MKLKNKYLIIKNFYKTHEHLGDGKFLKCSFSQSYKYKCNRFAEKDDMSCFKCGKRSDKEWCFWLSGKPLSLFK